MLVGEAVDVGEQLGELLGELVAVDAAAAQGVGGQLVGARGPAEAEVDPARVQALEDPEATPRPRAARGWAA